MKMFAALACMAAVAVSGGLLAQSSIVNPASEAKKPEASKSSNGDRLRSWEMPEVVVEGQQSSGLFEEQRIGEYGQPRWTAHRRFPTTRVYVRPEGVMDVEFWSRTKQPRHGHDEQINQLEFEFGLPYRFQLDLYAISRKKGNTGPRFFDQAVELRYAFADWGKLPFNPTVYLEWVSKEADPDVFEAKILLGDELAPSWHWGVNFVWEQEDAGSKETVLELTGGLSHTIIDSKFSIGLEVKSEVANTDGNRSHWDENIRVGPSLQINPLPQMHIDFAPLFGVTNRSRQLDMYIVVGWEF